jgi:glycerol-3-phosphate dehydrogenase (NAD(P)+)
VAALARRHGADMPISMAVDQVLNHGAGVDATIAQLLAHPYRFEYAPGS